MDQSDLMSKIDELLQKSKTAVMSSVDSKGIPRMRWMTPGILRGRPHSFFCITSPKSAKAMSIKNPSPVTWMIQNKQLTEIVNVEGQMYLVDAPALRAEVIEHIVKNLSVYWRINEVPTEYSVIETVITSGVYFRPMDNVRETVMFEDRS